MLIDVPDLPGVSWRDRVVAALMAQGKQTAEIAKITGVTSRAICYAKARIRAALRPWVGLN